MPQKIQGAQRDFSFGEIDVTLKRADDHPARKAGLRQMSNWRILNSGAIQNRSGRTALFPAGAAARIEEITMSPGNTFKLAFSLQNITIYTAAGGVAATFSVQGNGAPLPWTSANVASIVYAKFKLTIGITFPGIRPQVLTWDGVSAWSIADYNEDVTQGSQKRTPFYRLSAQGITMGVSAVSGNVTVTWSSPIVVAGMVGTRVRFAGRQIVLNSVISTLSMNATVAEPLPPGQTLTATIIGRFAPGDVVRGASTGAQGIIITTPTSQDIDLLNFSPRPGIGDAITGVTSGATGVVTATGPNISVSLSTGTSFVNGETITWSAGSNVARGVSATSLVVQVLANNSSAPVFGVETIVGPSAQAAVTATAVTVPQAIVVWDEEVFNSFRGYPASCFSDQFRFGFCNFPAVPNGISWSAINAPKDLYVGANPNDAMFELAPDSVQVYYVVPGAESSEFVFCDRKLYYIKIDAQNPLKPGSVSFQTLSSDGCAQVQPRITQDVLLYANAGRSSIIAITASGAYYRPFNTRSLTDYHNHLFHGIVAIAVPTADGDFNERYAYVLNADGSIAVGKYALQEGQVVPVIGWGPWNGGGSIIWVSAWGSDVVFTGSYFGTNICEVLDDDQYLDAAMSVNNPPAPFVAPVGKGPLWWIPNQSVSLMDQVTRSMGTYQIDVNGFIVPQNRGGENLASASLVAGQPWTATAEPFCPNAQPGADAGQRMKLRQISDFVAYVINSTGFVLGGLFSAKATPTSPQLGTLMNDRRFPAWPLGFDATLPPPLQETVERHPVPGSSYDPRAVLIKDTPGPLQVVEFGIEVSL